MPGSALVSKIAHALSALRLTHNELSIASLLSLSRVTCNKLGVEGTPDIAAPSLMTNCQKRSHDVDGPSTVSESGSRFSRKTIPLSQYYKRTASRATIDIEKRQLGMHKVSNGLSTGKARELHGVYGFNELEGTQEPEWRKVLKRYLDPIGMTIVSPSPHSLVRVAWLAFANAHRQHCSSPGLASLQ
jgi:hypothetical protein